MKGYVYILRCYDDRLYIGSTVDLNKRISEHQNGNGANFTKKRLPVQLVHFEEFDRIDEAFYREKQLQRWSRAKKEALVEGNKEALHSHAACMNLSHFMHQHKR